MSRNSSLFNSSNQQLLPEVDAKQDEMHAPLSEHDEMIFTYLVNHQQMLPQQARQKILNNDADIIELRMIESPTHRPLRK